jgi:hypothetical protein
MSAPLIQASRKREKRPPVGGWKLSFEARQAEGRGTLYSGAAIDVIPAGSPISIAIVSPNGAVVGHDVSVGWRAAP